MSSSSSCPSTPIIPPTPPPTPICSHEATAYGDQCIKCGECTFWSKGAALQCLQCYATLSELHCPNCIDERKQNVYMTWRFQWEKEPVDYEEGEVAPGLHRLSLLSCGCMVNEKRLLLESRDPYWVRLVKICTQHAIDGVSTSTNVPLCGKLCDACNKYNEFWEPLLVDHKRDVLNRTTILCPPCVRRFTKTCDQCHLTKHIDDCSVQRVKSLIYSDNVRPSTLSVLCMYCYDTLFALNLIVTHQ